MRGICLTSSYLALEPYDRFIIGKWITYVVKCVLSACRCWFLESFSPEVIPPQVDAHILYQPLFSSGCHVTFLFFTL